jgi:hypothetical protein
LRALNRRRARADARSMTETIDTLLDASVESHPKPSAIADELVNEAAGELCATDSPGSPGWDPTLHASPPTRTARGTWKLLRGRAAREAAAAAAGIAGDVAGADPDASAEAMCDTFFGCAAGMFGERWEPTPAERRNVQSALARYFRASGTIDLPPGLALVLAVGAYALPRTPAAQMIGAMFTGDAPPDALVAPVPGEPLAHAA